MRRLWNYIEPGKYSVENQTDNSVSGLQTEQDASKVEEQAFFETPSTSRKRKLSGDVSSRKAKSRRASEKHRFTPKIIEPHIFKGSPSHTDTSFNSDDCQPTTSKPKREDQDHLPLTNDVVDVSECSNSSW